jgi:uncharacterized BrkB/YihY/UPF0761 family membrane protein
MGEGYALRVFVFLFGLICFVFNKYFGQVATSWGKMTVGADTPEWANRGLYIIAGVLAMFLAFWAI